jgi:hypothetical protein
MTKLKIDLFSGTIEVDGEENFVQSVYEDFKGQLLAVRAGQSAARPVASTAAPAQFAPTAAAAPVTAAPLGTERPAETVPPTEAAPRPAARRRAKSNLNLIKDLDLSATSHDLSLRDFYAAKSPQTAMESNVVFVYYLQQIAGVQGIGVDHIYTCYKEVGAKYPNALKQSLADTSSRKNWLDTSTFDHIRLAAAGENFVEHELPRGAGR